MKKERLEIFYIRHADTCGNYGNRDKCDVDLSPLGEKQIQLLADRFEGCHFDAVLSSPLVRAVKTAAAVSSKLDGCPEIEIIPCLAEKNTMSSGYSGVNTEMLSRYYGDLTVCGDEIFGADGVYSDETDEDNTLRAKAVIGYFRNRFTYGNRIAVFAHGSFGNSFIPAAMGIDEGDYILRLTHTSVTKIAYTSDGDNTLCFMNDISHLRSIMTDYEFTV